MQYAIKTRDYINDYVWSWENDDPDSPLAEVSLELQKQIEGGQKGIAVIFRSGSFHVIITGIYKLGDKPIGLDFSKTKIRLSLVFSGLSQPEVKGVIQYFFANQDNLGIGFEDIVSWTKDSWTINDEQLNLAFKLIPTCTKPGKSVFCDTGGLVSLSDFNFSEQTEGVKYVFQSNVAEYLKIDLEPVPQNEVPVLTPPKETKPKSSGKVFSILSILCLLCAVGFLGWKYIQLNEELNTNNRDKIELKNEVKKLKDEKSSLTSDKVSLNGIIEQLNKDKNRLVEQLNNKVKELESKDTQINDLQGEKDSLLAEKDGLLINNTQLNSEKNNLTKLRVFYENAFNELLRISKIPSQNDPNKDLPILKRFIDELSKENSELKVQIDVLQKQIESFNDRMPSNNSSAPRPTPADDLNN